MRKLLVLLFLWPGTLLAQSPFNGTWVINPDSAPLPQAPDVYSLVKGLWPCAGCPRNQIKADGRDHQVVGQSYADTESVRIVDAHTVEVITKKAGKIMYTGTYTVSPDGGTLSHLVKDTTEAQAVVSETLSRRVAGGPAGSHAISGSWRVYKVLNRSDNGAAITYRCTPDGFSARTPLGEGYDAKFDGKFYLVEDDPGKTMASVKLVDSNTVEITSKRNDKVVSISHLSVSPDGESIHVFFENKEDNTTKTLEMQKQH